MNVISGTNGTCKSTLMHIISNSFQSLKKTDARIANPSAIAAVLKFVDKLNPKIESISRSDKETYNNPAEGKAGTLFSVEYIDGVSIDFRRHNSTEETKKTNYRFSIKPQYGVKKKDRLPELAVVYLGLSRLFPYGELSDAHQVDKPKGQLPTHIHDEFKTQYKTLTAIEIVQALSQNVVDVKKRNDFSTTKPGIDSNTISSGEDNISIILTALNCLRNITENITEGDEREIESILLIDEFDATLHPSAQKKLYDIIKEYAEAYRIQVFFTTHSLYILKYAYEQRDKIIYLVDQVDHVSIMPDPSPMEIELHLNEVVQRSLYNNVFIPVYTEDEEARFFLERILDYIGKTFDPGFSKARLLLHFVDANIGADSLRNLFSDRKMGVSSMRAICILDGDQNKDIAKHIIRLPGGDNPEKVLANYAKKLVKEDTHREFWQAVQLQGYSRSNSRERVDAYDKISTKVEESKALGLSTHGLTRILCKRHFKEHEEFYDLVMANWLINPANQQAIKSFRDDLHAVFMKTSPFYSIDKKIWINPKT